MPTEVSEVQKKLNFFFAFIFSNFSKEMNIFLLVLNISILVFAGSTFIMADGVNVKLVTFNFCHPSTPFYVEKSELVPTMELIKLKSKTSGKAMEVPDWLKTLCMYIRCQDKAVVIKSCNVERLFCFPGESCWKFQTLKVKNPEWIANAPKTDRTVVSPHWFPNDRIM